MSYSEQEKRENEQYKAAALASGKDLLKRLSKAKKAGDTETVAVLKRSLWRKGIDEKDSDSLEEFARWAAGKASLRAFRAKVDKHYADWDRRRGLTPEVRKPDRTTNGVFVEGLVQHVKSGNEGKLPYDQASDHSKIANQIECAKRQEGNEMKPVGDHEFVSRLFDQLGSPEFTQLVCASGSTTRDSQNLIGALQRGKDDFDRHADAAVIERLGNYEP